MRWGVSGHPYMSWSPSSIVPPLSPLAMYCRCWNRFSIRAAKATAVHASQHATDHARLASPKATDLNRCVLRTPAGGRGQAGGSGAVDHRESLLTRLRLRC